MLLTCDHVLATPLRKCSGHLSSGESFSTAELYSTLIVDTPASVEKGFFATSFDGTGNCASARKHLFVVSPDQSQGLDVSDDSEGHYQSSFLDTDEDSLQSTKDIASLILKAEQKLSVIRLSLQRALRTAERIRTLTSANGVREETAAVDEKGDGTKAPIPLPRRGLPMPHSIEEERNLRLVADLVLTPGKSLILSP